MPPWSQEAELTAWMRAALVGDADAYRTFLHCVVPYVRTVARSRCRRVGIEGEAEDIVQEVLLTIHLKRNTWDQSRQIGPWISAITRNKVVDALRKRGRRNHTSLDDVIDVLPAEEVTSSEIELQELELLIKRLPFHRQQIIRSVSFNGVSIRDVAKQLKMTEGAVRVSLHRALKALWALYRSNTHEN
jgi:RNA polymerase sigma-70 factor (ECF subfamily)